MGAKAFFKCHFFILVWTIIDVLVGISLFSKTFTAVVTIEVTTAQDLCC